MWGTLSLPPGGKSLGPFHGLEGATPLKTNRRDRQCVDRVLFVFESPANQRRWAESCSRTYAPIIYRVSRVRLITWCCLASGAYAYQPLTRSDCEDAKLVWDDNANVCAGSIEAVDRPSEPETAQAAVQPLTRTDCDRADMRWNDIAYVCRDRQYANPDRGPRRGVFLHASLWLTLKLATRFARSPLIQ